MRFFRPLKNPTSFRKMAAAMWRPPNDPHIFGALDVDATAALDLIDRYNHRYGTKITVTHIVVRALAIALSRHPDLNAKVGWSRIYVRPTIDIFCQVVSDKGRDLSGYKLRRVDSLSLGEISRGLSQAAGDIRADRDPAFRRSRNIFRALPLWAIHAVLRVMSFLVNRLDMNLPKLGMPQDPFGSAMVTSVGMFGIDFGFAPFTPVARCPMVITITRVQKRPWVVGGRVEPRPVLRLCGTFDHRVIDGFQGGIMTTEMEQLLSAPESLLTLAEKQELAR
jgi:pyruvate/2-oxoglutarate dehydrogenase complex dihydrolipoamide acyltransferase (E2) component